MNNPDIIKRAECLIEAYREALPLIPSATYQETGYQLGQVIKGFIPALLQTLAVLGISMVVGAGAGAVIGLFLGGVGVAPSAVVGGQLGLGFWRCHPDVVGANIPRGIHRQGVGRVGFDFGQRGLDCGRSRPHPVSSD
jgi:hypothetical protein